MRVANKTIYDSLAYRLEQRTSELNSANTVVTTGKRINSLSDDPIGFAKVLDLKSAISNLNQLDKNISTGQSWLTTEETALSSVKELIGDSKILALSMQNDTVNAQQRFDAAGQINGIIIQLVDLANTQANGQYVFSGTKTGLPAFVMDDETNPTQVSYQGNDNPFTIKMAEASNIAVGRVGEIDFCEDYVTVD